MTRPAGTSSLRHERTIPTLPFQKTERRGWGTLLRALPLGYLLAQALFLFSELGS